ncbi:MAG: universal stress protein [Deferrisomatales bacterium]|nr:universal stress protein [Deferrisomatales bacterium]
MYSTVLVALDGSPDSRAGASLSLEVARHLGCSLVAVHVYDAAIHDARFREMEPGLPGRYREPGVLDELRRSHDGLMGEGFRALSHGYLEGFLAEARDAGVSAVEAVARGRNYVELLRLARDRGVGLLVLGAQGLGAQGDGQFGSTAARVLRGAPCDVLLARAGAPRGPVLAGVDGSPGAETALRRAAAWSGLLGAALEVAAAYDPELHRTIFRVMGRALPLERQMEVGLDRQEELHDRIIDDGLGALYRSFLGEAGALARRLGREPGEVLLRGKAYRALVDRAVAVGAGLAVLGRFGHNREEGSDLGSHAEAVARLAPCHVLVAAAPGGGGGPSPGEELPWEPGAAARLGRVPPVARAMARRVVEDAARAAGEGTVTAEAFDQVARRLGMGPGEG